MKRTLAILISVMMIFSLFAAVPAYAAGLTNKITLSAISDAGGIKLTWKDNKASGIDGYQVFRYNASTDRDQLITTVYGTTWTDPKAVVGKTYKYTVRGYVETANDRIFTNCSNYVKHTYNAYLSKSDATIMLKGKLNLKLTGKNKTNLTKNSAVTWTSSDSTIAKVSKGVVTAVSAGTATIMHSQVPK